MKTVILVLLVSFAANAAAGSAAVGDVFELWPVTISLPVQYVSPPGAKPAILTRTLKNNDIINLVMGRDLSTKIDPKAELLALAGDASTPGVGSEIIVVNPTTRVKLASVWTLPTFNVIFANPPDDTVAVVYAVATVQATTAGTPAQNGFDSTSISMAGTGKLSGKLAVTSTALCGPFKFRITTGGSTTTYDGLVTKGSLKVSAASFGTLN